MDVSWLMVVVLLLPLSAVALVLIGDRRSLDRRTKAAALPMAAAFFGAAASLVLIATGGPVVVRLYEPGAVATAAPIGFLFDRLSAVMMTLITGISTLIYLYSRRYMQQEPGYARFLSLMILTVFVLQCMVSSANLLMLFVFWQLLTWQLYLLAHRHEHQPTLDGAFRTFTLLRVADMAFLSGIVLAYALYGTVEFQELAVRAAADPVMLSLGPGMPEVRGVTAVTLLIFIGAMGKSAQVPLHLWLPGSLYAPTPVHALLHAGIINAGGFLLNRLAPLYGLSSVTLHLVFFVGMCTAILGASMMLVQNDIKKTLGFSTIGQMGYMIMECGLGAFALAVFHLIAHGLFKATVFLNCGNVIHKARQEPVFPHGPDAAEEPELSRLTWGTGFVTTLLLPLVILLATHGVLRIPLLQSQGAVIFLLFAWATSSQAILTLTRLRAVASWKVSAAMLLTLLFVVFTYLFAAEAFTSFLYPDPAEVALFFQAAALPGRLFDGVVVGSVLVTVLSWAYLYAQAHGRAMRLPAWVEELRLRLYVLFMNRFYASAVYDRIGRGVMRLADCVDKCPFGGRP